MTRVTDCGRNASGISGRHFRRIALACMLAALSFAGSEAATRSDSIRARFLDGGGKDVLVAVHRGDWRGYAENSLEGIKSAIDMGADIVEIDLRRTADGELVLMHDSRIDRSTTGKGKVAELPLDSLKRVYLRSGVGERTPYRVPTLREVLVATKGQVLLNLDKAADYFEQVYALTEETGTTSQIIMKSTARARDIKRKYGKYLDKMLYMPVVRLDKPGAMELIKENLSELDCPAFEVTYADSLCTVPAEVKELLGGKKRIWYNTLWCTLAGGHDDFASLVDPEEGYGFLLETGGATIFQTDQPAYLIDYLEKRGLRPVMHRMPAAPRAMRLWGENDSRATTMTLYIPGEGTAFTGIGVVVCPGGGYGMVSMSNEGTSVGEWLAGNGITAAVLDYRLPYGDKTVPEEDAYEAVRYLRRNAAELGVDPSKVGIWGSSAGGHLATTVATHKVDDMSHPDFAVLYYPVVSSRADLCHRGSFENLLGKNASCGEMAGYSNELHVTADTPATLMILSDDDPTVNPMNSTAYYEALKRYGIPASMHIFPTGKHGYGFTGKKFPYHDLSRTLVLDWLMRVNPSETKSYDEK